MTQDALVIAPERPAVEWFDVNIPARGLRLSLEEVKDFYLELSRINFETGQRIVAELNQPNEMTEEQWNAHKELLLSDAFRLTVSITGQRDERIYAEDSDIFTSKSLPKHIKTIYFNNITAG